MEEVSSVNMVGVGTEKMVPEDRSPVVKPEEVNDGWTGNKPGMLQDDSRELSRALSETPDARRQAREAANEIAQRTAEQLTHEQADAIARYLRWNSVFFSPVGLQSLFPGLGPVKRK